MVDNSSKLKTEIERLKREKNAVILAHYYTPVSYTHLDVYKRQGVLRLHIEELRHILSSENFIIYIGSHLRRRYGRAVSAVAIRFVVVARCQQNR